jgi:hypothetical protein
MSVVVFDENHVGLFAKLHASWSLVRRFVVERPLIVMKNFVQSVGGAGRSLVTARPRRRALPERLAFLQRFSPKSMALKIISGVVGVAMVGGGAYGATNWVVGLASSSSGEGQSASVTNLTITASASAPSNLLYPGGTGDVVLTITNPNAFPVTITAVLLPTNTTYAGGFTNAGLTTAQTGCSTSTSDVIWNYSSATSGSSHTLTTPITVGPSGNANNPITVTLTNDASMTTSAPAACEATYFSMPSLIGVTATGGAASVTGTPLTDSWTS